MRPFVNIVLGWDVVAADWNKGLVQSAVGRLMKSFLLKSETSRFQAIDPQLFHQSFSTKGGTAIVEEGVSDNWFLLSLDQTFTGITALSFSAAHVLVQAINVRVCGHHAVV